MKIIPVLIGAVAAALALAGCTNPAQESDAGNAAASGNRAAVAPDNGEAANTATAQPAAPVAAMSAPTPSATPKADQPEAVVLPVRFGKYAVNQSCADAAAGNDYLGLSLDNWSEIDGDTPIGPFRNVGGNRWALGHGSGLTITVTGAKSFTEDGRKMTWCAA
jgi:hypothetical protein